MDPDQQPISPWSPRSKMFSVYRIGGMGIYIFRVERLLQQVEDKVATAAWGRAAWTYCHGETE